MRYLVFIIALFAALQTNAQNNIVYGAGINYTNGAPTFTPPVRTSRVAIDTVTGKWYHFNTPGGWQLIGNTIEEIAGCTAPAYTPGKGDSKVVINNCSPQPELYFYNGSAWVLVGGGSVYAGEGIRIQNDTIILDSLYILRFRTGSNTDGAAGTMSWNTTEETLDLVTDQGAVTGHLLESAYYNTRNTTGSSIAIGTVVMANGTTGNTGRILIAPAIADGSVNSEYILGLTAQSIGNNSNGKVQHFGKIRGIQTNGSNFGETWVDGDVLYCSAATPGYLTKVQPAAPNLKVPIAIVIHAHPSNGTLFVRPSHFPDLAQINDVQLSSPTNGQVLTYNSTLSRWENATPANQLQTLSTDGSAGNISISSGNTITLNVNDADASATNELQTLSTATNTLTLSNGGGTVTVDTDPASDLTGNGISPFVAQYTGTNTLDTTGIVWNGGRMGIGITSTTPNARLTVQGQGNTSTTTAINVQNSDGNALFRVFDNGVVNFGTQLNRGFWVNNDGTNTPVLDGASLRFSNSVSSQSQSGFVFRSANVYTATSGNQNGILFNQPFSPTSGSATFSQILLDNTINQTGGANGVSRGLRINPILTSAFDWRSIEYTNNSGWGLYGLGTAPNYLAGNTSIGSTSTPARLHVVGSGTSSSTWTAQFHNSGGANNALMIRDDGNVGIGTSNPGARLQIIGSTSDNTATALRAFNSNNQNLFDVRNDGQLGIGTLNFWYSYNDATGVATRVATGGLMRISYGATGATGNGYGLFVANGQITNRDYTSGDGGSFRLGEGYAPTSGTGTYNSFLIGGTINQTGGANGITRGILISPTLTLAADYRAIQFNNNSGWGIYGAGTAKSYFAGNVAIGTTSQNASSAFEVASTTQGILFPRMTTAQRDLIATPADGLVIYNTTDNKLQVRAGGAWVNLH